MDPFLEIRKLPPSAVRSLGDILDYADQWKDLMGTIPKHLTTDTFEVHITKTNPPKYDTEHIQIIQQSATQLQKSPTAILIDEWGTSGRPRANLGILAHLLRRANLYRAADYVSMELLGRSPVARPKAGPAATVNLELRDIAKFKPIKAPDLSCLLRLIEDPEMNEDHQKERLELVPSRQRSLESLLNNLEYPFSEANTAFYVDSDNGSTVGVEETKDVFSGTLAEIKPKKCRGLDKQGIPLLNQFLTKKDPFDFIVFSGKDELSDEKNHNSKQNVAREQNVKGMDILHSDNAVVPHISLLLDGGRQSMEMNRLSDAEASCQCGGLTQTSNVDDKGSTNLPKNNTNNLRTSNGSCKCPNIPAFSKILTDR